MKFIELTWYDNEPKTPILVNTSIIAAIFKDYSGAATIKFSGSDIILTVEQTYEEVVRLVHKTN